MLRGAFSLVIVSYFSKSFFVRFDQWKPRKSVILELEGQSYRMDALSKGTNSYEIRRGELRPRLELQKQLTGPFWLNIQGGYRIDYSFDVDELPEGREFFRGFFGEQPFGMRNTLHDALYFNIGISFVTL